MRGFNAVPVETTDLELIYNSACKTKTDDPESVQRLLGVIEGTLGKFFVQPKDDGEKEEEDE